MKGNVIIWICLLCKWISVSNQTPHQMDVCKCGKSYVDHEVGYTRFGGDAHTLLHYDLDEMKSIPLRKLK